MVSKWTIGDIVGLEVTGNFAPPTPGNPDATGKSSKGTIPSF